jgi:hypothetical protein
MRSAFNVQLSLGDQTYSEFVGHTHGEVHGRSKAGVRAR